MSMESENSIPPLISKSPPPSPNPSHSPNLFKQEPHISLNNSFHTPFEEQVINDDPGLDLDSSIPSLSDFNLVKSNKTEPISNHNTNADVQESRNTGGDGFFNNLNGFDNSNQVEDLNWANFDTKLDSFEANTDKLNSDLNKEETNGASELNVNKKEEPAEVDDEDEWADFVENTDFISTNIENTAVNIPVVPVAQTQQQVPIQATPTFNTPLNQSVPEFNLDSLVMKLFDNLNLSESSFLNEEAGSNGDGLNELAIDCDKFWQQLITYTSVTDASASLQFKWSLSDLEDNYIKSLNLNKPQPNQNKAPYFNMLTNEILKPVKVEHTSSTSVINPSKPVDNNNSNHATINNNITTNNNNINNTIDLSIFEANSTEQPNTAVKSDTSSIFNSLDIDLSYFESKSDQTSNKTKPASGIKAKPDNNSKISSNTNTNANTIQSVSKANNSKKESNSKVILDELLKDIFVNSNTTNSTQMDLIGLSNASEAKLANINKKDDDSLADKKSLSSSSSASSTISNAELSIQLQPSMLEQQQYNDKKNNDRKALDSISRIPNLPLNNNNKSKTSHFSILTAPLSLSLYQTQFKKINGHK